MECSHCGSDFDATPHKFALGMDQDGTWQVSSIRCPTCDRLIVSVVSDNGADYPVLPYGKARAAVSPDVPVDLAEEYMAAGQILPYSEQASAAISRRLLQRVLAAKAGGGYGGLADPIRRAVASPTMPEYLRDALNTLVKLAKLEPHDTKSYRCEALAPVNEGEAKWQLEVLKPLFDFYYVQPATMARMRRPIEERLAPPPAVAAVELEEAEGRADGWTAVLEYRAANAGCAPESAKEPVL
jgi:hypothetical protein